MKLLVQNLLIFLLSLFVFPLNSNSQLLRRPDEPVKIGLLIPDNKSVAAVQGAELAVRQANSQGGLNGHPFQIEIRSMEGPWGTGSKQAVDLIFNEKVWALMGSHDGRNAHLVEQAATKSTVVFVSAWSGDPTLSQAFVPWFFNCVHNDYQQAAALFDDIYLRNKADKVAIVSDKSYDSELVLNNFLRIIKTNGKNEPLKLIYEDYMNKTDLMADRIKKSDVNCIVLFCQPAYSVEMIRQFRQKEMNHPLYGSHYMLNENDLPAEDLFNFDNRIMIVSGKWSPSKYSLFRKDYQKLYQKLPGMVATYSFDAMNVLIEAIRIAGSPDREKIQEALENIIHQGVTGLIQFDDKGNRQDNFTITGIRNGIPSFME